MAFSFVASVAAGSTNGNTVTTGAIDTTGATLLAAFVGSYSARSEPSVTDSKGNSWDLVFSQTFGQDRASLYVCAPTTVGAGHTFTVPTSGDGPQHFPAICVLAFSHSLSAVFVGISAGAGVTGTSVQPGALTPPANDALFLAALASEKTTTISIDSGFTLQEQVPLVGSQHFASAAAYFIQGTAAALDPTWSWAGADVGVTRMIVFLEGDEESLVSQFYGDLSDATGLVRASQLFGDLSDATGLVRASQLYADLAQVVAPAPVRLSQLYADIMRADRHAALSNSGEVDLVWVEFTHRDGSVFVDSEAPLPDRDAYHHGFKPETLISVGSIDRLLSDRQGLHQVPSFQWSVADHDGRWRAVLADPVLRDLAGLHMLADAINDRDRRLEVEPLTIFRGVVRRHKPGSDYSVAFTAEDPLSAILSTQNDPKQLPRRTVGGPDFPNCGQALVGPSAAGYVVDGAIAIPSAAGYNLDGNHAAGATVLAIHNGTKTFAVGQKLVAGVAAPTVHTVSASSGTDPETSVTIAPGLAEDLKDGALLLSGGAVVFVDAGTGVAPPGATFAFSGHATVYTVAESRLADPAAWWTFSPTVTDAVADDETIAFRATFAVAPAVGRRVPWYYGKITDRNSVVPGEDAGDGQGVVTYVGDRELSDGKTYGEFLWCGHGCYSPDGRPIDMLYMFNNPLDAAGTVYVNGVPVVIGDLATEAGSGGRIALPGYDLWADLGYTESYVVYNDRWYTVLFLRGLLRDFALGIVGAPSNLGGPPLRVSAYGHATDPGGGGELIKLGPRVYLHALKNYVFGDYQGGAYLPAPTFPDNGMGQIAENTFADVEAKQAARVAGGGYRLDFGVGIGPNGADRPVSANSVVQDLNLANGAESGNDANIRFAIWFWAPDDDLSTAETLDDVNDILDESGNVLDIDDQDDRLYNAVRFLHTEDYAGREQGGWRSVETGYREAYDVASVAARDGQHIYAPELQLRCIRGKNRAADADDYLQGSATVADILARQLLRSAEAPRIYTVPTGMRGFNSGFELGRYIYIVSARNVGGRTPRPARIQAIRARAGANPQGRVVALVAEDFGRIRADSRTVAYA